MRKSKLKKLCAVAVASSLAMSFCMGCGSDEKKESNGGSDSAVAQDLVFNVGAEPETIDPTLNTTVDGGTIIVNSFEGLMRLDETDTPQPAAAESVDESEDGLVYTFHLRKDGKWSDGKPVVAGDFAYSWIRALTKSTGAEYSYQLFYIKNAEKYYNGEAAVEDLGIKVIDDYTLEVTLESPTSYFEALTAFPTLMPLREDIVTADPDGWAMDPDAIVCNGPFKLTEYNMKDSYVYEKNDEYWDADSVKLDTVKYTFIGEDDTAYASLKSGEFDMINSVPTEEIENGKNEGLVTIHPYLGTYFFCFNVGKNDSYPEEVQKALENKLVRQALSIAIDRKGIVEKVTKGDQVPAYSFVPKGIMNPDGNDFADKEYYNAETPDLEKAKELLAEAGYPNGEGLPTLELMYNSEGAHKDICEVIQQSWAQIGVNVELTNQEWAVFVNTRQNGEYEIARHGWIADYTDPMTFLDMWVTGGGNNDAGFSNPEYDSLIAQAKVETDVDKRAEMMRKAEDILMDEMPVLPIYYYTSVNAAQPNVKGVIYSALGQVTVKTAYKE